MSHLTVSRRHLLGSAAAIAGSIAIAGQAQAQTPIDRKALVTRHNPTLTAVDPSAPLMLGNGSMGFTADITGLQTFTEPYSKIAPLLTEAQWAWHSFPNPNGYTVADTQVEIDVHGHKRRYGYIKDWAEANTRPAIAWIRENPHRFSLGRVSFDLKDRTGKPARFEDIRDTQQTLDMWTGALTSRFTYDGEAVTVVTRVLPDQDTVFVDIASKLIADGRLAVIVKYPGVSKTLNPDPADWTNTDSHTTTVRSRKPNEVRLERRIDQTIYHAAVQATGGRVEAAGSHAYRASATGTTLMVMAQFSQKPDLALPSVAVAGSQVARHWKDYWTNGGMVEFAGSADPRATELERRVVLSQYLMAVNAAGDFPPQEEGLFSNSWNGKSHLEMHPWHSAHFALWGRPQLLERSLGWYVNFLPKAKARAAQQGVKGAWWPKMIGPDGADSPSKVSPFIMWQQPHPIYMSELLWRARKDKTVLSRYGELVEQSAELLASFVHFDDTSGRYRLGPPIIPVQENFAPLTTFDPMFEVAYFRWGIETAQTWRERRGLKRRADWDAVLAKWPALPQKDGLYLPVGSEPGFWDKAAGTCKSNALEETCQNRDHPSFLMPLGWLPGKGVDKPTMRRTLDRMKRDWDLRQTWGWDYAMIAMTATRLNAPDEAVNWLFFDAKNNKYGKSGMTPRVHLDAHAAAFVPTATGAGAQPAAGPDGPGYQRAAETYFPSNGSLLLAVALMAGGWDGETRRAPGFPKGWTVKAEGLSPSL
ncbi:hypothetical protein PQU92_04850 [Asticcacaulis sp. BYS171W]|uniref:Glycoside hydrolase family 65 n=1 Tax=Asticcacaulis aquaticus TaxID=2984212 RepID=A0ABT5HR98_9CAUL|nr:hypothetical protein [Asticcacaulis aquaticus]MDC7682591.1 hypothetical protein [Asticcacaulis aquaticus]